MIGAPDAVAIPRDSGRATRKTTREAAMSGRQWPAVRGGGLPVVGCFAVPGKDTVYSCFVVDSVDATEGQAR